MMLDMGFLPDVRRIMEKLPRQRQNLMFSATMPEAINSLSADILHDPSRLQITPLETRRDRLPRAVPGGGSISRRPCCSGCSSSTDTESVLIFTRTKHRAKKLGATPREGRPQCHLAAGQPLAERAPGRTVRLPHRQVPHPRGHRHRRARHRHRAGIARHQLRHPRHHGRLHAPHRPHRPRPAHGRRVHFGHPRRRATVRDIERVLGGRIERRTCPGFMDDASRSAQPAREPRRDTRPRSDANRVAMQRPTATRAASATQGPTATHSRAATKGPAPAPGQAAATQDLRSSLISRPSHATAMPLPGAAIRPASPHTVPVARALPPHPMAHPAPSVRDPCGRRAGTMVARTPTPNVPTKIACAPHAPG